MIIERKELLPLPAARASEALVKGVFDNSKPVPKQDIAGRSWAKIGNGIGTLGPGGSIAISRF